MIPSLSVVMPVHNALPFLDDSIRSILSQSYRDFEFFIRDDGSTDGSTEVLQAWAARDKRIKLYIGGRKLGPAESSNWVVKNASAPLIARMDADDISRPDRLARQVKVMESNPDTGLIGTLWEGIDDLGRRVRSRDRWRLLRKSPFVPFPHGSVMFRRHVFDQAGGYRTQCNYWEDLDLFLRIAKISQVLVIPQPLYCHRFAWTSTRLSSPRGQVEAHVDRMLRCLNEYGRGKNYEELLGQGLPSPPKSAPDVFVSLASTTLWSGKRPRILGPLWHRSALGWNLGTIRAIIWAVWADTSPRTLRKFLRMLVRSRDMYAGWLLGNAVAFEWRPNRGSTAILDGADDL